jgi:putative phage-type endonuclease
MVPEFFDMEQGSDDWFAARCGIPTASQFATILAKGRDGKSPSVTRREYMCKLAGEIVTGQPAESYSNAYMERGHNMEPEARSAYAFMHDADPQPVGFIRRGRAGASPDSVLGTGGLLEIKTKAAHRLIECMLRDDFPPEHKAQVQGQLWVAERDWCDLAVYWPGLPLVVFRAQRDEAYIKALASAVQAFTEELDALVGRIRAWGDPGAAKRAFQASVENDPSLYLGAG